MPQYQIPAQAYFLVMAKVRFLPEAHFLILGQCQTPAKRHPKRPSTQGLTIPRRYQSAAEVVTREIAASDPSVEILRAGEQEFPVM